jgi:UDP-N-acetylmuramoylalanine--D-glutamate ligase
MRPEDVVLLELSSFQLEDLASLRWSPNLAVITNIQPNHLDRHGTLEAYADAKLNIVRHQRNGDKVFVHQNDEALADRVRGAGAGDRLERIVFDPQFARRLHVPGPHNRDNAAAAIAVARALGISDEIIGQGLDTFMGLSHRLELVREIDGVRYFNDSKSTTPESTRIALRAFEEPLIVLVGGRGKGIPFDELSRHLAERAKAVICYGETGDMIYKEVIGCTGPARKAQSFEEAVSLAQAASEPGDVVVLSPACTSYDMFTNYEQRGDTFRKLVKVMAG